MYCVYVLQSDSSKQFYTDYTSNLKRRLSEHQKDKGGYTGKKGPYELVYYESCINKDDTLACEKYLKSGTGKRYVNNRLKVYLGGPHESR